MDRSNPLNSLSSAELDEICALGTTREFAAGTSIVKQGEPGTSFFLVREGMVEVRAGELLVELGLAEGRFRLVEAVLVVERLAQALQALGPVGPGRQRRAEGPLGGRTLLVGQMSERLGEGIGHRPRRVRG